MIITRAYILAMVPVRQNPCCDSVLSLADQALATHCPPMATRLVDVPQVKQQIWKDNQTLFGKEVSPLLSRYIEHSERVLFACPPADVAAAHHMGSDGGGGSGDFFSRSPKCRRQTEVVQALSRMVGKSVRLYDMVLQFLRTLFLRTRNAHYCTLRAELLMTLHDLEVHDICSVDPCHKFTWCLDACVRERHVDAKRAKELQGFLDGVRRGQEQVLGWVAASQRAQRLVYNWHQQAVTTGKLRPFVMVKPVMTLLRMYRLEKKRKN